MTVPAVRPAPLTSLVARTGSLLRAGVPLTLLLDLGDPAGPRSEARLREEAGGRSLR